MPGVVIDGVQVAVPGLSVLNWHDNPLYRLRIGQSSSNDARARTTYWVRSIILHTTKGIPGGSDMRPQKILPGLGPVGPYAENVAQYWRNDPKSSGAHLVCDFDGTWLCLADLSAEVAYHATSINEVSIGIEIYQGGNAELYEGQLDSVVKMVDFLTARFRIQRQIPHLYTGMLPPLASGGTSSVGVFGHRDQTDNRGPGDPGDTMMYKLSLAGYERFNIRTGKDIEVWKERQQAISVGMPVPLIIDGIPGPRTAARLEQLGYAHGLWVQTAEDRLRRDLDELAIKYSNELSASDFYRIVTDWLGP